MANRSPSGTIRQKYCTYISNCRARNMFWDLTLELFSSLIKESCAYCGLSSKIKCGNYVFNGIDRKNNRLGYTPKNVVACCPLCNSIKGQNLSYKQMLEVGKLVRRWRQSGRKEPGMPVLLGLDRAVKGRRARYL